MLTADEIYEAAIIRTDTEWDEVEKSLCAIVSSSNLFKVLNRVAEAALRLPSGTYAFNRIMYTYDKIDAVAKNKAQLGVF